MSEYLKPAAAIALPYVGAAFGSLISRRNISTWYENIKRPSWRPPNYLFGPVWTALYGGMGYASYLVWKDGGGFQGDAALPLALYGTQLALNWAWTPIFFGAHRLGLATIEIGCLWGTIVATIFAFREVNTTAAYIMVPYLGWVTFASVLNFKIWRMNKEDKDTKTS
ncbi:translocator protein-like [Saccostrea cucullata]|uniref:translocator protein-like n=1 Tax=Saccostrea cuccullata TaxID=36930 RepID=UPI002ED1EF08